MSEAGPKTGEEARALPEVNPSFWLYEHAVAEFPVLGDSIVLFVDKDGRSMEVVWAKGGWAKTERYS